MAGRLALRSGDSPSLWNQTLSPGWTAEENEILRLAIMKFGVGRWKQITESCCLPGKTPAQLNLQTQRLLGQQSLSVVNGIHLDPKVVFEENAARENVKRKNGLIIRSGAKLTAEEKRKQLAENQKKYSLKQEEIDKIELPDRSKEILKLELLTRDAKEKRVAYLKDRLKQMEARLTSLAEEDNDSRDSEDSSSLLEDEDEPKGVMKKKKKEEDETESNTKKRRVLEISGDGEEQSNDDDDFAYVPPSFKSRKRKGRQV